MNWYALSVKPQHEKAVAEQLLNNGLETYLPLYRSKRRWETRFSPSGTAQTSFSALTPQAPKLTKRGATRPRPSKRSFRTPDVVEFAVSPQVGQAVLAFARSYSSSGPKFSAGGQASTACPTPGSHPRSDKESRTCEQFPESFQLLCKL